jgi:hypothetical protein
MPEGNCDGAKAFFVIALCVLTVNVGDAMAGQPDSIAPVGPKTSYSDASLLGGVVQQRWALDSTTGSYQYLIREGETVRRFPVAVIIATVLAFWNVSGRATEVAVGVDDEKAVTIAFDAANKICGEIPNGGIDGSAEVAARLEADLPAVFRKMGLPTGSLRAGAGVTGRAYAGPDQGSASCVEEQRRVSEPGGQLLSRAAQAGGN